MLYRVIYMMFYHFSSAKDYMNSTSRGFNVAVGGGLGFTHNNQKTHPRLADVIGFCKPSDAPLG